MGYKDFREVYHKLAIVVDNGYCYNSLNIAEQKIAPVGVEANSALVYGYIDKMCGFSYKVLGLTYYENGDFTLIWPNDEIGLTVRGECFHDFEIIPIENKAIEKRFSREIDITNECYSNEVDEKLRSFKILDKFRHYDYPDDILIMMYKKGIEPEKIWVRIKEYLGKVDDGATFFKGQLLNEPYGNYGVHNGEEVTFFVCNLEGEDFAVCSIN